MSKAFGGGQKLRRVEVKLPAASYPVLIGSDAAAEFSSHLKGPVVTVFDVAIPEGAAFELLRELRGEQALENLIGVEGGEAAKTLSSLGRLLGRFERLGIDRGGTVLAIGGGTIGDLAGFAAAVWLRGVRYVNIPTTLLAMVDSSVGGKTGVNTDHSKNAVGAFWQPAAVLIDPRFLKTLPEEQVASAYGEIVKYAVTLDPGLIPLLESGSPDLGEVIERCVKAKAVVVGGDERDTGRRAILNYGHTVGHALEEVSGYTLTHGRAVAAGMRAAARISRCLGICDDEFVGLQDALLARRGLPGSLPREITVEAVLEALPRDKKARGGEIGWVLPRRLGLAETDHRVPSEIVAEAVAEILAG